MRKHVNLVDLVKSFPTNILLQNLASILKRTSPIKFAHLAGKSEKGSISNLSTKGAARCSGNRARERHDYHSLLVQSMANHPLRWYDTRVGHGKLG